MPGHSATKPARARPTRAAAIDERPPAPWGSFPLVEIVVFVGLLMFAAAFIVGLDEPRGRVLLVTGLVLASLAGLELSVREHFAGFRSHTSLLAAAIGAAALGVLYYLAGLSPLVSGIGAAVAVLVAAFLLLRVFRDRSGGYRVKLR